MADEPTDEPENEPTGEPEPQDDPPEPGKGEDEPDWKAEARKWEKRAKQNSDAAARLQELEDAQKTEQEKLTEKLSATEKRAADAELRAARLEVATEKGLPKSSVKFLTGTTPEELEESADELLSLISPDDDEPSGPSRRPRERLKPGASPDTEPEPDSSKLADSILNEGRL